MNDNHMNTAKPVHTEHILSKFSVTDNNVIGFRLFKMPANLGGSGHNRLPVEIELSDIMKGEIIIAINIEDCGSSSVITALQFWYVIDVCGDEYKITVNNLIGCGKYGEDIYDRIAGMVGAPPSVQ